MQRVLVFLFCAASLFAQTKRPYHIDSDYFKRVSFEPMVKMTDDSLWITTTGISKPEIILENTDVNAFGPLFKFHKNTASPAADDFIGTIGWVGEDDAGNERYFGDIVVQIVDPVNADESGKMTISVTQNDATSSMIVLDGKKGGVLNTGEILLNSSDKDVDLNYHEDAGTSAFFIESSSGDAMLGGSDPIGQFHVLGDSIHFGSTTAARPMLRIVNTNTDANGSLVQMEKISTSSAADDDILGEIRTLGYDDADNSHVYNQVLFSSIDVSNNDEAGEIILRTLINNSLSDMITLKGYNGTSGQGEIILNDSGQDVDIIMYEDDGTEAFVLESSSGDVSIGRGNPLAQVHIEGDSVRIASENTLRPILMMENQAADNFASEIQFYKNSISPAVSDIIGIVNFTGKDDGLNQRNFGQILVQSEFIADGDEAGKMTFNVDIDGGGSNMLVLDGYNGAVGEGEVTVNQSEDDVDFIVKDDSGGDAIYAQASTGFTGINYNDPQYQMDIYDTNDGALIYPLRVFNTGGSIGTTVGILLGGDNDGTAIGKGAVVYETTTSFQRGTLHFLNDAVGDLNAADLTDAIMSLENNGDVGVGTTDPIGQFHVAGDSVTISSGTSAFPVLRLVNSNTDNGPAVLQFEKNPTGSAADNDFLGFIDYEGYDDADNATYYGSLIFTSQDVTDGDEAGSAYFIVTLDNASSFMLTLDGYNGVVGQGEVTVNATEHDVDFIVKDDNGNDAIYVQSSTGYTGINYNDPQYQMDIYDTNDGGLIYPLRIFNTGSAIGTTVGILLGGDNDGTAIGKGAVVYETTASFQRGTLHFLNDAVGDLNAAALSDAVMSIENNGDVGVGTTGPIGQFHVAGDSVHFGDTSSFRPLVRIVNTNTDANGSILQFEKISTSSAADNDILGDIRTIGYDAGNNSHTYNEILFYSRDVTNNDEAGGMIFRTLQNNSVSDMLYLNGYHGSVGKGAVTINNSDLDVDFLIKDITGTTIFQADAADSLIRMNTGVLQISTDDAIDQPAISLINTYDNYQSGPVINFYHNDPTPGDADELGTIYFYDNNSVDAQTEYVNIEALVSDVTDATEDGQFKINMAYDGALRQNMLWMYMGASSFIKWNAGSKDVDFIVVNDAGDNNLYVDAADSTVTIIGNNIVEGYTSGRNIVRSIRLTITPGGTPGTDISIDDISSAVYTFNAPSITDVTNLTKSETDGQWTLNAGGTAITLNLTEDVIGILSAGFAIQDLNSSTAPTYYPSVIITGNSLVISFSLEGSSAAVDLTGILDAGDTCDLLISFLTSL